MAFVRDLCEDVQAPFAVSVMTSVVSMVLCLVTVPGNILICIAILKDPYHELSHSFNFFILQLALSDAIVGIITEPAFVIWHVFEALDYENVMNTVWVVHLSYFISCTASLLSLSALTLDRYLTVVSIRRKLSCRSVAYISALIWISSFSLPCIYFVIGFYLSAFIFANTAVIVTFVIVTFSYSRMYHKLRVQISRWRSFRQAHFASKVIRMEKKLTKAFHLIISFFILCLIPSCVMIYLLNFCGKECDCNYVHWLRDLQFLLTLVNCAVNQFLYAWRMPSFRRAIAAICSKSAAVHERRGREMQSVAYRVTISANGLTTTEKQAYVTNSRLDNLDVLSRTKDQQLETNLYVTCV